MTGKRVAVVVLGDLARSPRMLNHVRSLVRHGSIVSLIGYRENQLEVLPGVAVVPLQPWRRAGDQAPRGLYVIWSALRMASLGLGLALALLRARPNSILVQNPPSFPVLTVAALAARWNGAKLIIDWHNYGFSLLALRLGADHFVVRRARDYEFRWGRRVAAHLCVSKALQTDLNNAGIHANVLYDRPLTIENGRESRERQAPLRVVCPAGWSADENLEMLAQALAAIAVSTPPMEIHVTGEGPAQRELAPHLESLTRRGLIVRTGFLSETEYRDLVRGADLGISLHRSSSGLDLAMKVVDLYAARVPVCALRYKTLDEQVRDGVTGFVFSSAPELASLLERLAAHPQELEPLRGNIAQEWSELWDEAWQREAAPLLDFETPGGRETPAEN